MTGSRPPLCGRRAPEGRHGGRFQRGGRVTHPGGPSVAGGGDQAAHGVEIGRRGAVPHNVAVGGSSEGQDCTLNVIGSDKCLILHLM